jgi:uncharacterized membrane protein YoaT (DUF817 family)
MLIRTTPKNQFILFPMVPPPFSSVFIRSFLITFRIIIRIYKFVYKKMMLSKGKILTVGTNPLYTGFNYSTLSHFRSEVWQRLHHPF